MKRQYIHFAKSRGSSVISGTPRGCDTFLYIDIESAIEGYKNTYYDHIFLLFAQ